MRVLITGADGQLGWDLQRSLAREEVYAFGHFGLDICNRDAVAARLDEIRPACVVNAAAYNDVDAAESHPDSAFAVNTLGPEILAEASNRVGAFLIHFSTDYVFNGRRSGAYTEDDDPDPISVYGQSKYEGEKRVLSLARSACVVRTAGLYGQHGRNFVTAIQSLEVAGKPIRVVADQVGSPTATADLAATVPELIRTRAQGLFHAVNAGSCSWFQFAQAILGPNSNVQAISTAELGRPANRPPNSALQSVRWEAQGLMSLRSWRSALAEFLASNDLG